MTTRTTGRTTDFSLAVRLYNEGWSVQDVAARFGITRQSLWKSLRRRGVAMRPQRRVGAENHWYRGGEMWDKPANHKVEKAVRRGRMARQNCSECGSVRNVVAHHDDYNKPLAVRWLCKVCHFAWHRTNRAVPKRAVA